MKYSDAQKEATARYNKKAYDRINVIVKKGATTNHQGFRRQPRKKPQPLYLRCH